MPDDMQKSIDGNSDMHISGFREAPETDPLAEKWAKRIAAARKHWEPYHKRVRHSRKQVAGLDWTKAPDEKNFYAHRANLIHGTITAILPNIYARNPEISVTPNYSGTDKRLMCKTLEEVTNYHLENAKLKKRGKSSVKAALTCSLGIVKVMYQKDMNEDALIQGRIPDTQDNIANVENLIRNIEDPQAANERDVPKEELRQATAALEEGVEVEAAEGLVIDRVMSEHWLLDPAVLEFWDYESADWMVQIIPMKKAAAEARYGYKLDGAKTYNPPSDNGREGTSSIASMTSKDDDESQICVYEIWDRVSHRVYTMAEGCKWWLREPMSPPRLGERWYPFFVLPFQAVDGHVVGPSLVDLTERLQEEHNDTRDRFNQHRDLCKPGWNAAEDVTEKTLKTFTDSVLGEVSIIETNGKPVQQVIVPKQHPPIDPMVYDTTAIRYDWEQVSGMQDAARSSVVTPKTATEASIMQQSLSGRVSEFRDQVEDWLQEIAQYAAQVLLQELTEAQVERIMGAHETGPLTDETGLPVLDPATSEPIITILKPAYEWPQLSRAEVFDLVQLKIRAGTTGEPDKMEQQETWIKLLPVIQPLIQNIMQLRMGGGDAEPLINLLRETVARFDEKLDVEQFIPKTPAAPPALPGLPGLSPAPGMPGTVAQPQPPATNPATQPAPVF